MNIRQRIHFVDFVFFVLFCFFIDVNIYHLALFSTTPESFAIAVDRAQFIFSRIQVPNHGARFNF